MKSIAFTPTSLRFWVGFLALSALAFGISPSVKGERAQDEQPPHYTFSDWAGPPIRVWYHTPAQLKADAPIVFVMHGVGRDADRYYAEWRDYAETYRFVLLVPEFSQRDFPKAAGYNLGNVFDASGRVNPEERWSFTAIDRIFDEFRTRIGSTRDHYRLYGHSAGAQFVHRFMFYKPHAKTELIITANAGWYTMPDDAIEFPYGFKSSGLSEGSITPVLGKNIVVMLGDKDIDPNHRSLRRTSEAMAQGMHRYERGHRFYAAARDLALSTNMPFGWKKVIVPGAEHSNAQMAAAAAPLLAR